MNRARNVFWVIFYQRRSREESEKEIKEIFSGKAKWAVPGAQQGSPGRGLEIKIQMRQFSTGRSRATEEAKHKNFMTTFFSPCPKNQIPLRCYASQQKCALLVVDYPDLPWFTLMPTATFLILLVLL